MDEGRGRLALLAIVTVLELAAVFYLTDEHFKAWVDERIRLARHWQRRKRWERRFRALPGWAQEAIEQVHGRL